MSLEATSPPFVSRAQGSCLSALCLPSERPRCDSDLRDLSVNLQLT